MIRFLVICSGLFFCGLAPAQQAAPLVPDGFTPSPPVQSLLKADWLTEDERRFYRIRHGLWSDADLITPEQRAIAALTVGRFDDPIFIDPEVPLELKAEALIERGRSEDALQLLDSAG